jgi:hypothetical protein
VDFYERNLMGGQGNIVPNDSQFTLEKLYVMLASYIETSEADLNSTLTKLQQTQNVGQSELLAIQAKVQAWGTLCSSVTGSLRAAGDAFKATSQNIR